jgi:hypothetical protein
MVDFETIESDEKKFGTNNFIEVALKKAIAEDSENTFVSVSRGFVDMQGNRRYKKSIAIPMNKDLIEFVAKKIKEMGKDAPKAAKKVDEEAEEEVEEETEE